MAISDTNSRLAVLETRFDDIKADVAHTRDECILMRSDLKMNTDKTQDIIDLLNGFKVMAKLAKWAAAIMAAISAGWALVHQIVTGNSK